MQTIQRSILATAVLAVFLVGANAQTATDLATSALPPEVIAARTQVFQHLVTFVCNDVLAVKAAIAALDADKAAGLPVTANATAVQAARVRLSTDQQELAAAAKSFLRFGRLALKADQAHLKANVAAALSSVRITADKAAVDAAEAKLKTDSAANDPAALATGKATLDAARRQLVTDRLAALASSLAVAGDQTVLADYSPKF
jgi:hypothetical protein